jgi:hypothetical protein
MQPQGQQIGISESTYRALNKNLGNTNVENLTWDHDEEEIYVIYQQDKSVKAHPIDYFMERVRPYIHIGQPVLIYSWTERGQIFPQRTVLGSKIGILTGAVRQGEHENIVVFSDRYFKTIQDDWKKTEYNSGTKLNENDAIEGLTIHHWPTQLVLMNVKKTDQETVNRAMKKFQERHQFDEKFDSDVKSYYWKVEQVDKVRTERIMNITVSGLILCILVIAAFIILYLHIEAEMEEKQRRNTFLQCMGMHRKERLKLIRTEIRSNIWIPFIMGTAVAGGLTVVIWKLREYSAQDCLNYTKWIGGLYVIYLALQGLVDLYLEYYSIRKVDKL